MMTSPLKPIDPSQSVSWNFLGALRWWGLTLFRWANRWQRRWEIRDYPDVPDNPEDALFCAMLSDAADQARVSGNEAMERSLRVLMSLDVLGCGWAAERQLAPLIQEMRRGLEAARARRRAQRSEGKEKGGSAA